jgi:thymidylate synthase
VRRLFPFHACFNQTPLIRARKTAWRNCLHEWEWFMTGSSQIDSLHPSTQHWWRPWAGKLGYVNNNYSEQFRSFSGVVTNGEEEKLVTVDQINLLLTGIRAHPYSRRNVATTWNTAEMVNKNTPITNCHGTVIQLFVGAQNKLSLVTYQRSVDVICGLPHNWFQYWAFLLWLAYHGKREVGTLHWIGGDCHLYDIHEELAARVYRAARDIGDSLPTPRLHYVPKRSSDETFKANDFHLEGDYKPVIEETARMVV